MAVNSLISLEGTTTAEWPGLVGEATLDEDLEIASFELETSGVYAESGRKSICQMIYAEAQTEGQTLTVSLIVDDTTTVVGTFSTAIGTKTVTEFNVNRTGFIFGVKITGTDLTLRLEISSIELDLYTPDE